MGNFFSFEGRLNRAYYFLYLFLINLGACILAMILSYSIGSQGGSPEFAGSVGLLIGVFIAVLCAFIVVKRLHDIDRPSWHYWLLFIPFYNIYLGLVLLFKKGTTGPNKYGEDPLSKS